MKTTLSHIIILTLGATTDTAQLRASPIDYTSLDHTITLSQFRSGSHDDSDQHEYFLRTSIVGVVNTAAEQKLPQEKRRKENIPAGDFAPIKLKALTVLTIDKETQASLTLAISGDLIRQTVSTVMNRFKVKESQVSIHSEISLFLKKKKYFFIDDSQIIQTLNYEIIPNTPENNAPITINHGLAIEGVKGVNAKLLIEFKTDELQTKK